MAWGPERQQLYPAFQLCTRAPVHLVPARYLLYNMSMRSLLLGMVLGALAPTPSFAVFAHDYTLGPIEIRNPWSRATPASARAGAGYMVLTNEGATADRLISAGSAAADRGEIHEMKMDGNVMRMRELDRGITLVRGATVELKPFGFHVMFI